MSESRQTHVTLHDVDPQALDQLVQFAYTAEIVVGEGNVQVRLPRPSRPIPHLFSPPALLSPVSLSAPLAPSPTDSAPGRQPSAAERRPRRLLQVPAESARPLQLSGHPGLRRYTLVQ